MKKILVTGGAGFIGSHLVDELINDRKEVVIYDSLVPQVHLEFPDYLNRDATFIHGDLREREKLKNAVEDCDVIFHLAAAVGVGQSMYEIERYVDVNIRGTAELLDILVNEENQVKKLIVASSMSVYGEGAYECDNCGEIHPEQRKEEQLVKGEWELGCPSCGKEAKPIPTQENKPANPTSIYAISKKNQEEMCLTVGRAYGIPTVALRYFNVYGERQSLSNPYTGVCAIFISRIKNGNPPIIFEDGLQTRDFVHVKDVVGANLLVMEKKSADYEIFNVGTGKAISIMEVADVLLKIFKKGLKPEITHKYRRGDIRHCFADISKIKRLGYSPSIDFSKGMEELVRWSTRQHSEDKFDEAYEEVRKRGLVG